MTYHLVSLGHKTIQKDQFITERNSVSCALSFCASTKWFVDDKLRLINYIQIPHIMYPSSCSKGPYGFCSQKAKVTGRVSLCVAHKFVFRLTTPVWNYQMFHVPLAGVY